MKKQKCQIEMRARVKKIYVLFVLLFMGNYVSLKHHWSLYGVRNNNLNEDAAQTRKFIETRIVSRSLYEGRFTTPRLFMRSYVLMQIYIS